MPVDPIWRAREVETGAEWACRGWGTYAHRRHTAYMALSWVERGGLDTIARRRRRRYKGRHVRWILNHGLGHYYNVFIFILAGLSTMQSMPIHDRLLS